ncbi:MAG: hypothetical protein QOE59_1298, partial [Actinomycetota bacterium]|nr:hypothetical protein [Actinomycetota bacterium]
MNARSHLVVGLGFGLLIRPHLVGRPGPW